MCIAVELLVSIICKYICRQGGRKKEADRAKRSIYAARSHMVVQKIPRLSVDILRQIAEGKSGRIILEECLPGYTIGSRTFPISKRWRK